MTFYLANIHLAQAIKQENSRLTTKVAKSKVELAHPKDKVYFCEEHKCELESHKDKILQTKASEKRTMTKMATLIDKESHWESFYMKHFEGIFLKVMSVLIFGKFDYQIELGINLGRRRYL